MRIAFISTMRGNAWGGSEELWFEAAREAISRGHEVIASVGHWGKSAAQLEILKNLGAAVHFQSLPRKNLQRSDIAGRMSAKLRQAAGGDESYIFAAVGKFAPDVICISQANTHDIPRFPHLRDFLIKQNAPYAIICHGHEDIPLSDEARFLTKAHFAGAVWVGFVAQSLINSAERHLAATIDNAFVIRNPVNLSDISEIPFVEPDETVRFANVARVECYQKGQDILLEALSGESWRERDWQLSFAGEGPHVNYLRELAAHYGIADKVRFLGQISDIRKIWAEHHLLLLPSRYEGTPLSLVEAMLCGRTAVVTDIAGNCEWISDDVNGFVAAAPSAKSLREALERAWEKRFRWREMGEIARRTAVEQYPPNPGAILLDLLTERGRVDFKTAVK